MAARFQFQSVNPLLGVYFGIFVASLFAVVVLLLILEQLGVSDGRLRIGMLIGSVGLYATIGAAAYTNVPNEFLLSGRRVPSFFVGMVLAVTALGGTGLVTLSGAIFLAGFDALCIPLGIIAGLVAGVVLIAPFMRKFGAPTVPCYLGLRFDSGMVRLAAATAASAPLILLLIAELKIAMLAMSWLVDLPTSATIILLIATLIVTVVPGGIRSLSWSSAAQSMACLLALLIPATIIAVMVTNLPLGQVSHGPVLRALGRTELAQGIPIMVAPPLAFDLPGLGLQPIAGRFAMTFGSVGSVAFVLASLTVMLGIASLPSHLGRTATTPSVYETRKSMGWAVFIAGIMVMTLSALAVFYRDLLVNQIAGASAAAAPHGLKTLVTLGLAEVDANARSLTATSVTFRRDGALLGLPLLMGFPSALVYLVAAGALAAALAAAAACLTQLGTILAEDVIGATSQWTTNDRYRLAAARLAIVVTAIAAVSAAALAQGDPLELLLWALALSGGALFPVLLLSIWWKRINALGAVAGLGTGFFTTVLIIAAGRGGSFGIPSELSAAVAAPLSFAAAILVSVLTPAPGRHVLEMVRELRIPGGETVYDRETRLARQKRGARA